MAWVVSAILATRLRRRVASSQCTSSVPDRENNRLGGSLFGMGVQDALLDTFQSVKRQRRATANADPGTGPALSRNANASGARSQRRRTLFFPVKQDEMVEKCRGVPEWRVRAPIPGVHNHGSGIVYVAFSSLAGALNYANILRNPPPTPPNQPPSKPPMVDSRITRKRSICKKRPALREEESDDILMCNTDQVMSAVVAEQVDDAFSLALGERPSETTEDSKKEGPWFECEEGLDDEIEDALSNVGNESTEYRMGVRRGECRQAVISPLSLPEALVEPCTPPSLLRKPAASGVRRSSILLEPTATFSVRTVQHVSRKPWPSYNALSTTIVEMHMKQSSLSFVLPESKDKRMLSYGNDWPVSDTTPKRRGNPREKGMGPRSHVETTTPERGASAGLKSLFEPITL